jgi:hypothetical protein
MGSCPWHSGQRVSPPKSAGIALSLGQQQIVAVDPSKRWAYLSEERLYTGGLLVRV